jgi:hypothetical protein
MMRSAAELDLISRQDRVSMMMRSRAKEIVMTVAAASRAGYLARRRQAERVSNSELKAAKRDLAAAVATEVPTLRSVKHRA